MVVPVIGKFSTARSEWTPQYASAGTSRSPSRSCSMRVLVISSPRDVLFDSGFSGRCSMPMEPHRHRYFRKSVKLTDRSSSMPHTFVRSQGIGRGLTLVRDVRNTNLHPV